MNRPWGLLDIDAQHASLRGEGHNHHRGWHPLALGSIPTTPHFGKTLTLLAPPTRKTGIASPTGRNFRNSPSPIPASAGSNLPWSSPRPSTTAWWFLGGCCRPTSRSGINEGNHQQEISNVGPGRLEVRFGGLPLTLQAQPPPLRCQSAPDENRQGHEDRTPRTESHLMARLENQIAEFSEGASHTLLKIVAPQKAEPKPTKANAALHPQLAPLDAFRNAALKKAAFYADENVLIFNMDVREALAHLAESGTIVNCMVTSPPFYGQRDYGVDGLFGHEEQPSALKIDPK